MYHILRDGGLCASIGDVSKYLFLLAIFISFVMCTKEYFSKRMKCLYKVGLHTGEVVVNLDILESNISYWKPTVVS
jgi:hypothetical protein